MATIINEQLGIRCVSGEIYVEIFRGIRTHLADFLSHEGEDMEQKISSANLGIGHALARHNIKFDEKR